MNFMLFFIKFALFRYHILLYRFTKYCEFIKTPLAVLAETKLIQGDKETGSSSEGSKASGACGGG